MSMLQGAWYWFIAYLIIGFAVLSGFDFGMGMLYFGTRTDEARKTLAAAIGPYWDGNEVWLIGAGAALFASFPPVYATVFSGFYLAMMLLLFTLVARAVSIEFAAHTRSVAGRAHWSTGVALASLLAVLLLGVAFGNILRGVPLDAAGQYHGGLLGLLNPFSVLVGLLNVAMILAHGAIFLGQKTEEPFAGDVRRRATWSWAVWLLLTIAVLIVSAVSHPHLLRNYLFTPGLWLVPGLTLVLLILAGVWNAGGKSRRAVIASSLSIIGLLTTAMLALFPLMVPARNDLAFSLTAANASASAHSLQVSLIFALISLPFILGYHFIIYRIFSGKVKSGEGY